MVQLGGGSCRLVSLMVEEEGGESMHPWVLSCHAAPTCPEQQLDASSSRRDCLAPEPSKCFCQGNMCKVMGTDNFV